MRKHLLPLVVLPLALTTAGHAGQFKVTSVYDGDTFEATGHEIEIKVSLMAIDAPEMSKKKGEPSQPFAEKAKQHLTDLVYGKVVEVKGYGLDRYNRILGVVHFDGKNINLEMIRAGLAEAYRGKMRQDFDLLPYLQAEQLARNMNLGMWGIGNIYISPKKWRNKKEGP